MTPRVAQNRTRVACSHRFGRGLRWRALAAAPRRRRRCRRLAPPPLRRRPTPRRRRAPDADRGDPELEPQVTIIRSEDETVEEVRIGGELRYVRVTPRHGRPYFLIPDGSGAARSSGATASTSRLKVPMWVLFSW